MPKYRNSALLTVALMISGKAALAMVDIASWEFDPSRIESPVKQTEMTLTGTTSEVRLAFRIEVSAGKAVPAQGFVSPRYGQHPEDWRLPIKEPASSELEPANQFNLQATLHGPARCPDSGVVKVSLYFADADINPEAPHYAWIQYKVKELRCVDTVVVAPKKPKLDPEQLKEGTIVPGKPGSPVTQ